MVGPGKKILVVDDEEDLCEILKYNLINEGFDTEVAHSAEEALQKPLNTFDMVLLDIMMGPISGFKLADVIHMGMNLTTSIIFMSARDSENDIITGYSLGADDYIIKPFSINELIARVKAVFKRSVASTQQDIRPFIKIGNLELDNVKRRIIINDEAEDLTRKEYEILKLLIENRGKVLSRGEILKKVWGEDINVKDRAVDVNIAKIRAKLGKYGKCLSNRAGCGYFFEI